MRSRPGRFYPRPALCGRKTGHRATHPKGAPTTGTERGRTRRPCGLHPAAARHIEDGRFDMAIVPEVALALGVPTVELVRSTHAWTGLLSATRRR